MFIIVTSASAQGTAFTYQGRLNVAGNPASGSFDLTFLLFNVESGGSSVAGPITNEAVAVSNGLFTTTVNFGVGVLTGTSNWLQIAVRTNGVGAFTTLAPRQQLTPTPYAIYSSSAGTAGTAATATSADSAITATTANGVTAGSITSASIASGQVVKSLNGLKDAVTLSPGANVTITPSGNTLSISAAGGGSSSSGVLSMQVFASSGTFIVPAGVNRIMVDVWGGGGGGGASAYGSGSGGGGSGFGRQVFAVTPGTSFTVTIGTGGLGGSVRLNPYSETYPQNGGTSSFGTSISASGGRAGANAYPSAGVGGAGGTSSATFNVSGAQGSGGATGSNVSNASSADQANPAGGSGGAAGAGGGGGGGGRGRWTNNGTPNPGSAGAVPGGGGGGGGQGGSSAGGAGGNGRVVVYW